MSNQPWKDSQVERPPIGEPIWWTSDGGVLIGYIPKWNLGAGQFHWLPAPYRPTYVPPLPPLPGCPCGGTVHLRRHGINRDDWYTLCERTACRIGISGFSTYESAESAWRRIAPHWGTV